MLSNWAMRKLAIVLAPIVVAAIVGILLGAACLRHYNSEAVARAQMIATDIQK